MGTIGNQKCDTTAAGTGGLKTSLLACPLPEESLKLAYGNIMSQSNLLEIVRRHFSPDTTLEVPASRLEYDQVQYILETEEQKYPRLLYDGVRNVAIIKAAPSALHGQMAESLVSHLSNAANSAIGATSISGRLQSSSAETNTQDTGRGRTTREWDTALYFQEGRHATLMIAVEVAVSQSHTSLQRAISWSICALKCRLGLTMAITESRRRSAFGTRSFASLMEAESAIAEYETDFESQLSSYPYGPLERDGVVL
ncbi:hypothetical protein V1520DRAFT_351272 [Lipomyces starkeyi]